MCVLEKLYKFNWKHVDEIGSRKQEGYIVPWPKGCAPFTFQNTFTFE